MQRLGFGLPVVERARETDGLGGRIRELKANRHDLWAGILGVVVIVIVFHSCDQT